MRISRLLCFIVVALLLPFSSQAASIQGKIVDAESDVGVYCPAYFYSGGCGIGYEGQAWSDADGYFIFTKDSLPDNADIYIKVMPGNAGSTIYVNEYYDGAPTCATATSVKPNDLPLELEYVNDPESAQIFKLKLHHPSGGGTVRGHVTYHGAPLENLQVQAYTDPCSGYISYGKTYTDANGFYELEHLPSGDIFMKACPGCTVGFEQTNQWWTDQPQNTEDCNQATAIVVSEGSEHNSIDFALTAGAVISGTLFDEYGSPIVDSVVVHAYKDDPCSGTYVGGAVTGYSGSAAGTYIIDQLPAGTIYVRTDCNNRPAENYVEVYYDGDTGSILCQKALAIELASGASVSGVDMTVPEGGIIQGQVLSDGEPVGRTRLKPYFNAGDSGYLWLDLDAYTESDGTFVIKHIPEGDVFLFAFTPVGFEDVWWSDVYPEGVADWENAAYMEVLFPDDHFTGIDFSLIFYPDLNGDCDVDGDDLAGLISSVQDPAAHTVTRFAEKFGGTVCQNQ